jgi:LCP family protein required for cell wall assembly
MFLGVLVGVLGIVLLLVATGRSLPSVRIAPRQVLPGAATPLLSDNANASTPPAGAVNPGPGAPAADGAAGGVPLSLGGSRFAVVLLGYGGPGHDGAYLTDSIVVVIVDPTAKTLTLLSVPRDSWVPLEFDGRTPVDNKINTAYAFAKDGSLYPDRLARYRGPQGAGTFAADTIARVTGVPIESYVGLDFQGFRQMIDAVGGIDVNVPDGFSARYPRNDDPSVDASWMTVTFTAGPQHFDGERAIEYARAREAIDNQAEGSDFARSRRQRVIMEAFKNRVLQPAGLVHLPQVLGIASQHVDTNYAIPSYPQLAQLVLGWKDVKIYQTALSNANYLQDGTGPDGTYVLVPTTPDRSWSQVRAFTRRLWDDPELGVQLAATRVVVVNASGQPSLGSRVVASLTKLGYVVAPASTAPRQARSRLVDGSGGASPRVVQQLLKDLGQPGLETTTGPPADSPEVTLVLGEDATDLAISATADPAAPVSAIAPSADTGTATRPTPPPPTPTAIATPTPPAVPTATPTSPPPTPTSGRATPISVPDNPNFVVVPNLVGLSETEAQRVINESGLMTTYVNYQTVDQVADRAFFLSIPPGAVLSQSPPAGTRVPRGTRIALAVRKQ